MNQTERDTWATQLRRKTDEYTESLKDSSEDSRTEDIVREGQQLWTWYVEATGGDVDPDLEAYVGQAPGFLLPVDKKHGKPNSDAYDDIKTVAEVDALLKGIAGKIVDLMAKAEATTNLADKQHLTEEIREQEAEEKHLLNRRWELEATAKEH